MVLAVMSLVGGVLTVALVARHRFYRREGQPEVPYGVAISVAASLLFYEPILNHLG
jgi:prepilin peptidase CpaA